MVTIAAAAAGLLVSTTVTSLTAGGRVTTPPCPSPVLSPNFYLHPIPPTTPPNKADPGMRDTSVPFTARFVACGAAMTGCQQQPWAVSGAAGARRRENTCTTPPAPLGDGRHLPPPGRTHADVRRLRPNDEQEQDRHLAAY
ncbi:Hypp8579 [Branchiostoma lanceolatum]|uniref:Hypp8579 protein n=1 Tax=Branchiostoma lanceolatum TaxID=7740 RepID=A0A8K0EDW2_BRALA|nr:Hypp8579 [Branchiostoma lanceolatum]